MMWPEFSLLLLPSYRKRMKRVLADLGLDELKITPHGLRYGAASEAARSGVPTEDIMTRGRWSTRSSLIRYMQPGLLVSQLHLVPAGKLPLYQRLVDDPDTFFQYRQARKLSFGGFGDI